MRSVVRRRAVRHPGPQRCNASQVKANASLENSHLSPTLSQIIELATEEGEQRLEQALVQLHRGSVASIDVQSDSKVGLGQGWAVELGGHRVLCIHYRAAGSSSKPCLQSDSKVGSEQECIK